MAKRQASESLDEVSGVASPAVKKSRILQQEEEEEEAEGEARNGADETMMGERREQEEQQEGHGKEEQEEQEEQEEKQEEQEEKQEEQEESDEEQEHQAPIGGPLRQSAPTEGYADLYLDTIDRNVLDFDFEKLCSVSLSNINVYACLVCGRYFQGRGPKSHAYFHALDEDHHVFISLESQRVWVLPEGYEVKSKSLDDIKYVSDPRYSKREVMQLDRRSSGSWTLAGKHYTPGFVGINNIKENDYVNVVVQALAHVTPLRNYFVLEDLAACSELVRRCSTLLRKMWNPRAFRAHVSPHELLQEVSLRSSKRFTLTAQSDPVDFLSWFLNNLHLGLGGSRSRPGSSIIQRIFQGRIKVESQAISARAVAGDRLRFQDADHVDVALVRFLLLTLDLPPAPLFQDELERNIIPQVPLTTILAKYDGQRAQEHHAQRKRHRLLHPLPPFLMFHIKRFSQNKFVAERNPTIVTFDARNLDMSPFVEPDPAHWPPSEPIWYDLVANIVHEAVRRREDVADSGEERKTWKVQVRDKATGQWLVCQDLFVDSIQGELLYLGESYLQIWERRKEPKADKGKGKA